MPGLITPEALELHNVCVESQMHWKTDSVGPYVLKHKRTQEGAGPKLYLRRRQQTEGACLWGLACRNLLEVNVNENCFLRAERSLQEPEKQTCIWGQCLSRVSPLSLDDSSIQGLGSSTSIFNSCATRRRREKHSCLHICVSFYLFF